jgi:acetoacetyl-CoA synthetase
MSDKDLPLWWTPSQELIEASNLAKFQRVVNAKYKLNLKTYEDVHKFSVERMTDFWEIFWDYSGIRHQRKYDQVLTDSNAKPGDLPRFFEGARVNLAENILFPLHPKNATACMPGAPKDWPPAKSTAIYEYGEGSASNKDAPPPLAMEVTWGQLRKRVANLSTAFRKKGLKAGDRIANVSANTSDPIVAFLASLAIGAVFSALPTDAGEQAIYGRLSQIQPKLVLTDDCALYNGKEVNVVDRVARVADNLLHNGKIEDPSSFEVVCLINKRTGKKSFEWKGKQAKCSSFEDYLQSAGVGPDADSPLHFDAMPFNHPALIVFSSGTTGEPKSICHSAGGILVNSKKEALLHHDMGPLDTFLQLTTCGWIMWLSQVGNLLAASSIVTYDGSPLFPSALTVPRLISKHKGEITGFGASPRLLSEIERQCKADKIDSPKDFFGFKHLKFMTSTGSPLSPTNVRFFYEKFAPKHVHLISISGGTDLAGCLVGSAVDIPVYGHLIGAKSLAIDLCILDPLTGEEVEKGESGELMVRRPFPTQPLYFWGAKEDKDKLHDKYMESYYRRYAKGPAVGYWAQGDFISRHPRLGGYEIHGRADGVLNPSGVRWVMSCSVLALQREEKRGIIDCLSLDGRKETKSLRLPVPARAELDERL